MCIKHWSFAVSNSALLCNLWCDCMYRFGCGYAEHQTVFISELLGHKIPPDSHIPPKMLRCVINHTLRHAHTMKVMRIGSKLICIVCVHTECALTEIHIECAFSQSTSKGGLKPV